MYDQLRLFDPVYIMTSPSLLIRDKKVGNPGRPRPAEEQIRQPSLFDFSWEEREVILLRLSKID